MSTAYPLHLEREIDRRWLHRFVCIDHPVPLDRPQHPNDTGRTRSANQRSPKAMNRSLITEKASDGILIAGVAADARFCGTAPKVSSVIRRRIVSLCNVETSPSTLICHRLW